MEESGTVLSWRSESECPASVLGPETELIAAASQNESITQVNKHGRKGQARERVATKIHMGGYQTWGCFTSATRLYLCEMPGLTANSSLKSSEHKCSERGTEVSSSLLEASGFPSKRYLNTRGHTRSGNGPNASVLILVVVASAVVNG